MASSVAKINKRKKSIKQINWNSCVKELVIKWKSAFGLSCLFEEHILKTSYTKYEY